MTHTTSPYLLVHPSPALEGEVSVSGAKNGVLVIMASLLLTRGVSTLYNVPHLADVIQMALLLEALGAKVEFDTHHKKMTIDTSGVNVAQVPEPVARSIRASILVLGPLLARYGHAHIPEPGGCGLGPRPIDFHVNGLRTLGVRILEENGFVSGWREEITTADKAVVFECQSVGATENILMYATLLEGCRTELINAALEPEVADLIKVLQAMGARIWYKFPQSIVVEGVKELACVNHAIMPDRLEAGSLLLAAAATRGSVHLPNALPEDLELFLYKLEQMGHTVKRGTTAPGIGIHLLSCQRPRAVSFKTGPHPGFPTDLQAPMMAAQLSAYGMCIVEETIFENRFTHIPDLVRMGADVRILSHEKSIASVSGCKRLQGTDLYATNIRACMALTIAALIAQDSSRIYNIHHWRRGYDHLEEKLCSLGANIKMKK